MKKLFKIIFFIIFIFSGCEVAPFVSPIVTGVVMWSEGEAHKYYPYNHEIIYRATKRTLEDMNMNITEENDKRKKGKKIIANNGEQFKINIDHIKEEISLLSVRIDFMGNKEYAELFYSKVDHQLSTIQFDENGIPYFLEN
jgi:hypothetical protein